MKKFEEETIIPSPLQRVDCGGARLITISIIDAAEEWAGTQEAVLSSNYWVSTLDDKFIIQYLGCRDDYVAVGKKITVLSLEDVLPALAQLGLSKDQSENELREQIDTARQKIEELERVILIREKLL